MFPVAVVGLGVLAYAKRKAIKNTAIKIAKSKFVVDKAEKLYNFLDELTDEDD